jgi:hypothetical protein
MKTQIIRLESHDDVVSIRDKMSWSRAPRILLAFPRRRPPKLIKLDLILLKRAGRKQGGQLGLVTLDNEIDSFAKEVGIPVFPSIPAAQRLPWRRSVRHLRIYKRPVRRRIMELNTIRAEVPQTRQPLSSPLARLSIFSIGVSAFLALVIFFLPSASIELTPQRSLQRIRVAVWASPDIPAVLPSGALPAQEISMVIEDQLSQPASEQVTIANQSAHGTVILKNLTDQAVSVPVGTIFRTTGENSVQVESLDPATILPGVEQFVEVRVRARAPGTQGNLPADSIQAVEGILGLSITVSNPEPLRGGSEQNARTGSEQDYAALKDQLLAVMRTHALADFEASVGDDHFLIRDSLLVDEIIIEERNPAVGVPTDRVTLKLKVAYRAWVVAWEDLYSAGLMALDASLPEGRIAVPDTFLLVNSREPTLETDDLATWEITVSRSVKVSLEAGQVTAMVKGLDREQAQHKLQENLNLAYAPDFDLRPGWWHRLPFLPFRIAVFEK